MKDSRHQRVKQLFNELCMLRPEERLPLLEALQGDDASLRADLVSLLDQHDALGAEPGEQTVAAAVQAAIRTPASVTVGPGGASRYRFASGATLDQRYRIIEQIGRGGMGEVYRAEDLKLHQVVAIKFLPADLKHNAEWLDRFRNEVRIALQITHPNVCRVHDIGEIDGEPYITMEYIDGRTLNSLMRSVGRFNQDKALQFARQLCSGLAAAHDKGVLHRDLKPANIMIDGDGHVRVMDFGLAAPMGALSEQEGRAGTPAYMAPEQWTGRGITQRTDVYALGLVLYEMFTGRRAFEATTATAYKDLHLDQTPAAPNLVTDGTVDPAIERVILRCLEKDQRHRPGSAREVAAMLPGGNPLAELIAAGQTPTPEMVAAAGSNGTMRPLHGFALFGLMLVSLMGVMLMSSRSLLVASSPPMRPPAVLNDRAELAIRALGYEPGRFRHAGFSIDRALIRDIADNDPSPWRWDRLREPGGRPVHYWLRMSDGPTVPLSGSMKVSEQDPPLDQPGMLIARVEPTEGRLTYFYAVPRLRNMPEGHRLEMTWQSGLQTPGSFVEPDWSRLLELAGLDPAELVTRTPTFTVPFDAEVRIAWTGLSDPDLHIEAAGMGGRVAYFRVLRPHETAERAGASGTVGQWLGLIAASFRDLVVLLGGAFLAWQNIRLGRGDRRGAFRIAAFTFCCSLGAWVLTSDHVLISDLKAWLVGGKQAIGLGLYNATVMWLYYIALEPHVRRIWPETLIGWTRVITGRVLDPLVGREILLGCVAGAGVLALAGLSRVLVPLFGQAPPPPMPMQDGEIGVLMGLRMQVGAFLEIHVQAIGFSVSMLVLLLLLRVLTHRRLATELLAVGIYSGIFILITSDPVSSWPLTVAIWATAVLIVSRAGLLAMVVMLICGLLLMRFPITSNLEAWYSGTGLFAIGAVVLAATYGLWQAVSERLLYRQRI